MHGPIRIRSKLAITEMYPRIPWELVVDTLGSAKDTSGTTALRYFTHIFS